MRSREPRPLTASAVVPCHIVAPAGQRSTSQDGFANRRKDLRLAGDRRTVHHVVLEVCTSSGAKTLRLLNEYTVNRWIATATCLTEHRHPPVHQLLQANTA